MIGVRRQIGGPSEERDGVGPCRGAVLGRHPHVEGAVVCRDVVLEAFLGLVGVLEGPAVAVQIRDGAATEFVSGKIYRTIRCRRHRDPGYATRHLRGVARFPRRERRGEIAVAQLQRAQSRVRKSRCTGHSSDLDSHSLDTCGQPTVVSGTPIVHEIPDTPTRGVRCILRVGTCYCYFKAPTPGRLCDNECVCRIRRNNGVWRSRVEDAVVNCCSGSSGYDGEPDAGIGATEAGAVHKGIAVASYRTQEGLGWGSSVIREESLYYVAVSMRACSESLIARGVRGS